MESTRQYHFEGDTLVDPDGAIVGHRVAGGDRAYLPEAQSTDDILRKLNAHEELVATCDGGWGTANNIIANMDGYEGMTLDQLQHKILTSVILLKSLRAGCASALSAAKGPTNGSESGDCEVN